MKVLKTATLPPPARRYTFGRFRLDTERRLLTCDAGTVPLTPKAYETLLALVRLRGRVVEKSELMQMLWPDSFVEENNLNQSISALRKALGDRAEEPRYIKTVPGRGYRFVAEVEESDDEATDETTAAQPDATASTMRTAEAHDTAALIAATTDATPPDATIAPAQKSAASAEREELAVGRSSVAPAAARRTSRKPLVAVAAVAVVLLAASLVSVIVYRRRSAAAHQSAASQTKSLAVLPFKSLGGGEDEYLGLGMTDVLITRVSNLRGLVVRPTSAVRRYAGRDQDALTAGRELRVDDVLEGTVQRAGERVRVSVRLLSVADGRAVWGETFDEELTDMFAVEDSVAEKLAGALALRLSDEELKLLTRRYTDNAEAYRLYLKGRYYSRTWTTEGFAKARDCFDRAIALDPTYAPAYAGLADAYYRESSVHQALQDAREKARAAALEALRIDDGLAEAHASLAAIRFRYDWDFAGAEAEFRRALDLNPNYATAHEWYSEYLTAMGRFDEAAREARLAQEIDPLSPEVGWDAGLALLFGRRYEEAAQELSKAVDLNPRFWLTHNFLAWAYSERGDHERAVAEGRKALELDDNPDVLSLLVYIYAKAGRRADAQKALDDLLLKTKQGYVSPFYVAAGYAGAGDREKALEWLAKAYDERAELLVFLKVAPNFDALRGDPRFAEIVRRVGLSP